jgi:hypothetical protein
MLAYEDLPTSACPEVADRQRDEALYVTLSKPLVDSLVKFLEGKKVLECYAGRGHLSALLQSKGIDIKPTSLQMGHDYSAEKGHVTEVELCSVMQAVQRYRDWMQVLLVTWPTTDDSMFRVLPHLPRGCPIIFIGEVTDYARKPFPFLGGCATDEFFAAVRELPELTQQLEYPTCRQDTLKVFEYLGAEQT